MNLKLWLQIKKLKKINTVDKYINYLQAYPTPDCEQWYNFQGYQNDLDTKGILSA